MFVYCSLAGDNHQRNLFNIELATIIDGLSEFVERARVEHCRLLQDLVGILVKIGRRVGFDFVFVSAAFCQENQCNDQDEGHGRCYDFCFII